MTDTNPVVAAGVAVVDAQARLDAANADLKAADQVIKDAWTAYRGAVVDGGSNISALQDAIDAAERAQRFAKDRAEHLAGAVTKAQKAHAASFIESFRPTWEAGVAARIKAAQLADRARGLLKQAEAEAERGADLVGQARARGFSRRANDEINAQLISEATSVPHTEVMLRTEAVEREIWESFGV